MQKKIGYKIRKKFRIISKRFYKKLKKAKEMNFKDRKTVLIRNLVLFFRMKKPY